MKIKIYFIVMFFSTSLFCQTLEQYFPLKLKADGTPFGQNDYSSAYGPRNYGEDNYDFHAAIDIGAVNGTAVYPIFDGVVLNYNPSTSNPNDENLTILHHDDQGYFMTRYFHIDKLSNINEGDNVVGGTTQIATVKDYNFNGEESDHLDVRYCEDGQTMADWGNYFLNASNPGYVMNEAGQNDTFPWLVKANGLEQYHMKAMEKFLKKQQNYY